MRKLTIGIIIGLIVGLSGQAFAAVGDVIEAKFIQFTFVVDGETKELEADPINYQGTTYLPVRVVANLLGREVVYRADTRTIELNMPETNSKEGGEAAMDTSIEQDSEATAIRIRYLEGSIHGLEARLHSLGENPEDPRIKATQSEIDDLRQELAELQGKQ